MVRRASYVAAMVHSHATQHPYRPDIDGLRAIAVLGVILFHLNLAIIPGGYTGVDVFFVISGFLISGILWREFSATGHIDFVRFWSRRFRRLMPMSVFVVLVTLAFLYATGNAFSLNEAGRDGRYAIAYVTNWHELNQGVDYFAEGGDASFFQHYWSLAVEEQYYILISLVFLGFIGLRRFSGGTSLHFGTPLLWISLFIVASFGLELFYTTVSQPHGFFGTQNRVWQFGIGALTMMLTDRLRQISDVMRLGAGAAGLVLILASYFLFAKDIVYPGFWSLVPTIGAGLLIFGNGNATPLARVMSVAPLRYLGRISYSLYLWHWGVILAVQQYDLSNATALIVASAATLVLSVASYHLIENPLRHSVWLQLKRFRTLAATVACLAVALPLSELAHSQGRAMSKIITLPNGATADVAKTRKDIPKIYTMKPRCHADPRAKVPRKCVFGDVASNKVIVLFGDSHAAQWFPAVEAIAKQYGYRLLSRTKSGCGPVAARTFIKMFKREYTECNIWRDAVMKEIKALKPTAVILGSASTHNPIELANAALGDPARLELLREKSHATTIQLAGLAEKVFLIFDTPDFAQQPLKCLARQKNPQVCGRSLAEATQHRFPWFEPGQNLPGNVHVISMNDVLCPNGLCLPFDDKGINFYDTNHMTASYSRSLSKALYAQITAAGGM
jgi:peptidoglycan/LPS O-acetylase OafA/YrhL